MYNVHKMQLRCKITAVSLFIVYFLFSASFAHAEDIEPVSLEVPAPVSTAEDSGQLWNLEGADIRAVINQVADITGKNFLVDPQVQGQVTLVSSQPLTQAEVYPVFLSMLQALGYAAVGSGDVVKILPDNRATQSEVPVANDGKPVFGDERVVQVVPVNYVAADQLVPILRPLLPNSGHIASYGPSNALIISGNAANVSRLVDIIDRVDVFKESEYEVEIIPVHNAIAAELVQTIDSLQSARKDDKSHKQIYMTADDASNSILLSGDLDRRVNIRVLISQLDSRSAQVSGMGRDTQVIYLKYLSANEMVPVLASVARAHAENVGTTIGKSQSLPDSRLGFNLIQGNNMGSGAFNNGLAQTGYGAGGNLGSAVGGALGNSRSLGDVESGAAITVSSDGENAVEIAADPVTNALIITAPPALISQLKKVIARLDIRPAQVLVEAVIVEISEDSKLTLGVDWQTSSTGSLPTSNSMSSPTMGNNPSSSSTSRSGNFFEAATQAGMGFIRAGDLSVVLSALVTDTNSNILSTPSVVVQDNQEAAISIGQTIPVPTGAISSIINDASTAQTQFERQDIALSLMVIPRINRSNSISLQIFQENETIVDGSELEIGFGGQPTGIPRTNKSQIQTSVVVEDGDILVLGGLISNERQSIRNGVPVLSKIPVLGQLFRTDNNSTKKRNLMVFLRPVIMYTSDDGIEITNGKYNFMRNQQISVSKDIALPEILPPWGEDISIPLPNPFGE